MPPIGADGIPVSELRDFLITTLTNRPRGKLTDLGHAIQEYHALPNLFRRYKKVFDGGSSITETLNMTISEAGGFTQLFASRPLSRADGLVELTVPWRFQDDHALWDLREPAMNSGHHERILNEIKVREMRAMGGVALNAEIGFWGKPADSTDTLKPYGVDYWITPAASAVEGFNGLAPTGFTTKGGIDPTVHTRFKNWNGQYTDATKTDLVVKMRKAATKTQFKSPVGKYGLDQKKRARWAFYVGYDTLAAMEGIAELQNDRLGFTMDPADGKVMFRGNKVEWVPFLDDDSEVHSAYADKSPVLGIDWNAFYPVFLDGWFLRRDVQKREDPPLVVATWFNLVYNYVCCDPRACFRLQKA
jgi:hypothetical protein